MRIPTFLSPLVAALMACGTLGAMAAPPAAVGSGSGGTVEGRTEGSTNSNSMGEPVNTTKKKGKKKSMRKASADTMSTGTESTKNGSPKGEAGKVP